MTLADLSSRDSVLATIDEYDRIGRWRFIMKYKFGDAGTAVSCLEGDSSGEDHQPKATMRAGILSITEADAQLILGARGHGPDGRQRIWAW